MPQLTQNLAIYVFFFFFFLGKSTTSGRTLVFQQRHVYLGNICTDFVLQCYQIWSLHGVVMGRVIN